MAAGGKGTSGTVGADDAAGAGAALEGAVGPEEAWADAGGIADNPGAPLVVGAGSGARVLVAPAHATNAVTTGAANDRKRR